MADTQTKLMGGFMIDALGDPFERYIADHHSCVLVGAGIGGPSPLLVRYHACGLEIYCLLPLWADLAYGLDQDPRVVLVIPAPDMVDCWLEIRGTAAIVSSPDWSMLSVGETGNVPLGDLYCIIRIHAHRLDLYDGRRGWGARETLELAPCVGEAG